MLSHEEIKALADRIELSDLLALCSMMMRRDYTWGYELLQEISSEIRYTTEHVVREAQGQRTRAEVAVAITYDDLSKKLSPAKLQVIETVLVNSASFASTPFVEQIKAKLRGGPDASAA